MSKPCIICVAITGSLPRKENNPAVPITVAEQVESAHAAVEAGASIIHAHVRNDDQTPTSDPDRFARLLEGLRRHVPEAIVQFSTGGRSGAGRERGGMLSLRPDMASLVGRIEQLPHAGLREQPRPGGLARLRDADPWREAGDRGLRPQPHFPGRGDG